MEQYVATIGFFDGVHLGHLFLLEQVRRLAGRKGMRSMVVTFDRHPRQVLSDDYVPSLLSTLEEKSVRLCACGIDSLQVLSFTREMSRLSALEFMEQVLSRQFGVKVLVMGYDHHFGHGKASLPEYVAWGKECGIEVVVAKEFEGGKVSSSIIRRLLMGGDVIAANKLLGYAYSISGQVVRGHQVGRTIGFPTANIQPADDKLLPSCGVYAVRVEDEERVERYDGMLCIGHRPTVKNGDDVSVEVNLFDYDGDLYDHILSVELVCRLRDEWQFNSLHALQVQLAQDARRARQILFQP